MSLSLRRSDVLRCSLADWLHRFSKVSLNTEILPLPEDVLDYLRDQDGLVLPVECDKEWAADQKQNQADDDDDEEQEQDDRWDDDDGADADARPSFPAFSQQVRAAVSRLGGQVFCKLNWSAPRDAVWMAFANSLCCTNLSQIYLLLKSSDFVRHDLTRPFEHCVDDDGNDAAKEVKYALVLRQWSDLNPGHELRCFVRRGRLVGVTQRDATHFYPHLHEQRASIVTDVRSFFREHVRGRFPLDHYVFDVVRSRKDHVVLVDFNPFCPTTDSILFDWDELLAVDADDEEVEANDDDDVDVDGFDFRYVEHDAGIQPNGMRQYALPRDMVDLATGADPDKLVDFLKLQERQQSQ